MTPTVIALLVVAWAAVAVGAGLVIGRTVRHRNTQIPRAEKTLTPGYVTWDEVKAKRAARQRDVS